MLVPFVDFDERGDAPAFNGGLAVFGSAPSGWMEPALPRRPIGFRVHELDELEAALSEEHF